MFSALEEMKKWKANYKFNDKECNRLRERVSIRTSKRISLDDQHNLYEAMQLFKAVDRKQAASTTNRDSEMRVRRLKRKELNEGLRLVKEQEERRKVETKLNERAMERGEPRHWQKSSSVIPRSAYREALEQARITPEE